MEPHQVSAQKARPFVDRPCWACHWFGYASTSSRFARCLNPNCSPNRSLPERGCSCWIEGEEKPKRSPFDGRPYVESAARIEWAEATRERLVKIQALASKAMPSPYQGELQVKDLSGLVVFVAPPWMSTEQAAPFHAIAESLGINRAIRAGRL